MDDYVYECSSRKVKVKRLKYAVKIKVKLKLKSVTWTKLARLVHIGW